MISGPTITILIYFKRMYDCLSRYVKSIVLGPAISEKSSNENGHILTRMSENQNFCCRRFSFDDFSVITWPKITILIYSKTTYYRLSRYINVVVLSPVMYECSLYDAL